MSVYDEVKEEVKAANDIVDVVSRYVKLKKSGRNYMGLCPFHSEKTPSFNVRPDNQFFYCFGCHAGGDVFTFISKIENMTFNESLEFLAERVNIKLPENKSFDDPKTSLKEKMLSVNSFAPAVLILPALKSMQTSSFIEKKLLNLISKSINTSYL